MEERFKRLAPHIGETEGTVLGESAFGWSPMVALCQKDGWHALFRVCAHQTCQPYAPAGHLFPSRRVSDVVAKPGSRFYGRVRFWQEEPLETNLSASWDPQEEEALLVSSDQTAGGIRLQEYRLRWRVEATFQDGKRRGWQWESCQVRRLDRIDRMLLVLFLAVWWLVHGAASCLPHGKRDRSDRHDRRDKSLLRMGRRSV